MADHYHSRKLEISSVPPKAKSRDQLIHRHLTQTKSIYADPQSKAERQIVRLRRLWWLVFGVEAACGVGGRGYYRSRIKLFRQPRKAPMAHHVLHLYDCCN